MNRTIRKKSALGRLGIIATAVVLALGVSGAASARGYDDGRGHRHAKVVHHHYHGKHYGDRRFRRHRPKKVVHVHHHYPPQVVYERPPPVVYERRVVVEQPYEPAPRVYDVAPSEPYARPGYGDAGGQFTPRFNPGSLMGAALGGLIGSQIGGGTGKLAATAAATVGGFVLGDHVTRGYR